MRCQKEQFGISDIMCEKGDQKRIKLKGHVTPRRVDACLVDQIKILNKTLKLKTVASCCGHGVFHATILLKSSSGVVIDHFSKVQIPSEKKRFNNYYKKDKETGFYYIPVVEDYYRLMEI